MSIIEKVFLVKKEVSRFAEEGGHILLDKKLNLHVEDYQAQKEAEVDRLISFAIKPEEMRKEEKARKVRKQLSNFGLAMQSDLLELKQRVASLELQMSLLKDNQENITSASYDEEE